MESKHAFALVGRQKNDAGGLERPANLIARGLKHLEAVLGLEALERGQRYPGPVSERLLRPSQQRARGP